jgi:hypothetical protein
MLEGLTLAAVVVYAGLTFWQVWLTRQAVDIARNTFDTVNRPYVGIAGNTPIIDSKAKKMAIRFPIKNFGTVPATDFLAGWKPTLNGKELIVRYDESQQPGILMPGEFTLLSGGIGVEHFDDVMVRLQPFDLEVVATYNGPGNHKYKYCAKLHYLPQVNGFSVISVSGCTLIPGEQ